MKYNMPPHGRAAQAFLAALLSTAALTQAQTEPVIAIPTGTIRSNENYVRVGSNVQLTWDIKLPPTAPTLSQTEPTNMEVRMLGIAYGIYRSNRGHGNNIDGIDSDNTGAKSTQDSDPTVDDEMYKTQSQLENLPVNIFWSKNGGSLLGIFCGDCTVVNPAKPLLSVTLQAGDKVDFAAQGWNKTWGKIYSTANSSPNVVVLRDGDPFPVSSASNAGLITPYLKPYLDSGKNVQIGSRDLLIVWELDTTNPNHADWDHQDAAILVTLD